MKDAVVCGRYSAAKIYLLCLTGLTGIGERNGMIKKGIHEIHAALVVDLILQFGLFRFTAKMEVRKQAPIVEEIDAISDRLFKGCGRF